MRIWILSALALLTASTVEAATVPACWYRDVEQLDETTYPPEGGDISFFTAASVIPNVVWVVDDSGSMMTLPCNGNCGTDGIPNYKYCNANDSNTGLWGLYGDPFFTNMGYPGYEVGNPTNTDVTPAAGFTAVPPADPDFCISPTGLDTAWSGTYSGADGCFYPGLVYTSGSGYCGSWSSSGNVWAPAGSSVAASTIYEWCLGKYASTPPATAASPSSCSLSTQCPTGYTCQSGRCKLPTTQSSCWSNQSTYTCPTGYTCDQSLNRCVEPSVGSNQCVANLEQYGYDPGYSQNQPVFTGDLLNFYPPKFVTTRRVMKKTVMNMPPVRQALFTFANSGSGGGKLLQSIGPACSAFVNSGGQPVMPDSTAFTTQAQNIAAQLNTMAFSGSTPTAETEVSVLQYFTGNTSTFENSVKAHGTKIGSFGFAGNILTTPIAGTGGSAGPNDSICWSCEQNFVVYITDGLPTADTSVPCVLQNYDQDCREGLQKSPSCSRTSACPSSGVFSQDFLDDVANFGYMEDLRPDYPGKQNVVTDTIGFLQKGTVPTILQRAAAESSGVSYTAANASDVENALASVVNDINTRGTAFSAASVSTVQTQGTTYAFIPRFSPNNGNLWTGHLFRFNLFNEFTQGCSTTDFNTADAKNPNGNASCGDVYLQDANGHFVQENNVGQYMVVDTTQPWDATNGWPIANPPTPATPFWDAGANLVARNLTTNPRTLYTVVDVNGDGVFQPSELVPFSATSPALTQLETALALGGPTGPACTSLATLQNKAAYTTEAACALDLIKYVIGFDLLNESGANNPLATRPTVLGDTFHSAPILVTPPVPESLC